MNEMNQKKLYLWRLAQFLRQNDKIMSGPELADHLNRNNFKTAYGTVYEGERGTYTLVHAAYRWVNEELGLGEAEAACIAEAFITPRDTPAWKEAE